MTARNKDHGVAGRQASGATGGSFHETPQASNGGITLTAKDWSTDPWVLAALGEGPELDDDQERLLNILLDPTLDEFADPDDDLLERFGEFDCWEDSDIEDVAYRLQLHHQREEGRESWWFHYSSDTDGGWYEVGSYLPGTPCHVTTGEDGKYLARAGDGLRGAIEVAGQIDDLWRVNRRTMQEHGLLGDRIVLDDADKQALGEMASDAAAEWEEFEYRSRQAENGYTAQDIADYQASMERQQAVLRKLGMDA